MWSNFFAASWEFILSRQNGDTEEKEVDNSEETDWELLLLFSWSKYSSGSLTYFSSSSVSSLFFNPGSQVLRFLVNFLALTFFYSWFAPVFCLEYNNVSSPGNI